MSRPSRGYTQQVTFKLDAAHVEQLKREAERRRLTLAELIRQKLGVNETPKGERQ